MGVVYDDGPFRQWIGNRLQNQPSLKLNLVGNIGLGRPASPVTGLPTMASRNSSTGQTFGTLAQNRAQAVANLLPAALQSQVTSSSGTISLLQSNRKVDIKFSK